MLKSLCIFFLALAPFAMNAETKAYPSVIDQVTVYRNGAHIKRMANVKLTAGENEIVIGDLPAGFDESSIRVNTKAKTYLISISYRNNFNRDFSSNAEYKALTEQIRTLKIKLENEALVAETWKEEENLLLANKKLSGDNTTLTAAQLTAIADLYRVRLLEIKQKMLDSRRRSEDITKDLNKAQAQLNEWTTANSPKNTGEVVVVLNATTAGEISMELSYFDGRASWQTGFELHLTSLSKPLNLLNKGSINQYTGEVWKNVNVVLTTGNPSTSFEAPVLNPWFLYYFEPYYQTQKADMNMQTRANARPMDEVAIASGAPAMEATASENITFMEYSLPAKMTIPSDNKMHDVTLKDYEVPAKYHYLAIPRLDNKVYLISEIEDWGQYSLSSGTMKIYFEDTYIGDSYLNAAEVSDTLSLSLGPDIAIATKREKLKDYKKTSFLSSKKQISSGWETSIKNNKTVAIDIIVRDQLPLSTDGSMEIEADDLSGGKLDPATGIVEWKLSLKPGEQVKRKLAFTVKVPKDKKVSI
ncbi:MAG: DUF4139 domain-containing protein [Saprospiraceae bacterium]|nr:DUF4139 domain-containing protein [Saprospiraceae bacterium]